MKAFKYRIYPNKTQEKQFFFYLDKTRELYNAALKERIGSYEWAERQFLLSGKDKTEVPAKDRPRGVTYAEQSRLLTQATKDPALADYKLVYNQVLRDVLKRLDKAFQMFFTGNTGYPKFKGKRHWNSFCFTQIWRNGEWEPAGKLVGDGTWRKIQFPTGKRGKYSFVRLRYHRPLEGTPKTLTIKREGNQWYAVYTCEGNFSQPLPKTGKVVGIDMGVNPHFLTDSEGGTIAAPRFLREEAAKLAKQQKSLSKKKRGSKRRNKARVKLANTHARIARKREDFHWKVSSQLVKSYDIIVHEDLDVKNMTRAAKGTVEKPAKNKRQKAGLNKSILDAGWGSFLNKLEQQANKAGRTVIAVPPAYTSQDCNECGTRNEDRKIGKAYTCKGCGVVTDGDFNAARNILEKGLTFLGEGDIR